MKKIFAYLLFIIILTTCDEKSSISVYTPNSNITLSPNEHVLDSLINNYRVQHNLQELKIDSLTTRLAIGHVLYMIDKGVPSHDGFNTRANLSHAKYMGEIVAYNYSSSASILAAYLASPPHKAVLDNPKFTHIGISTIENYNCCILTAY